MTEIEDTSRPYREKLSLFKRAELPGERSLDTGVRIPGMHLDTPPPRTHRDAAAEAKRRMERERLREEDPVVTAERQMLKYRDPRMRDNEEIPGKKRPKKP